MNKPFEGVKGKLGFGFMRLPLDENKNVCIEPIKEMVDIFMNAGFNYFDTAHGYVGGKSETALKEALVDRYPRESYVIADKLSSPHFKAEEEIRPLIEEELRLVGVDYFDFFLMHAQDKENYAKYKKCRAFEIALEMKNEGKIKHLGMSFHDTADVLDLILTEHPELEFVQIQLNYADYDDPSVQSRKCLEVANKHSKPVIVMEPVKGGTLVNLPDNADQLLRDAGNGSNASYAIRFAAGCEGVFMVLSGMGTREMVLDNTGYMKDFKPLSEREMKAVMGVVELFKSRSDIPCTDCKYCVEVCPKNIRIPSLFACLNAHNNFKYWNTAYYYSIHTDGSGRASDCIKCGMCEKVCPQHIKIRDMLEKVSSVFDKEK